MLFSLKNGLILNSLRRISRNPVFCRFPCRTPHTGISDDVKIRPREHVRDDAGHSSSAITDKYIDVELRERHNSAKRKRIKPEFIE